ncbi:hypothetical protein CCP2SC5_1390005 [Azospirillaceae bacterium]
MVDGLSSSARSGFKGRVYAAILGTGMLTVIATGIALLSFNRFGETVFTTNITLPALSAALHLSEHSASLAAIAPILTTAETLEQVHHSLRE